MEETVEGSGSGFGRCDVCNNTSYLEYMAEPSLFSQSELAAVTTLCVPLLVFGLLGNILTVLVVWLCPQMRSTTYLYLGSMAVSDTLILLLMPLDLYKLWWYRPWLLGDAVCKLSQFLSECCTFSSILHMTALGVERYVAVCFPLKARLLVTRGRVRGLIGGLWGVAMLSAGPVLVLVGVEDLGDGVLECRSTQFAQTSGLLRAMLWLYNLYFLLPLPLLSLLYGLIARRLRRRPHPHNAHRHTLRMMVVIVVVFVLCWLPFHTGRTLFSVGPGSSPDLYYISQYLNLISFVLFYLSAAINPLLYNIMSARYRANVCSLLHLPLGLTEELHRRAHPSPVTPSFSSTHF
ncbi:growth hormone secretagogue receptor type 1-like [Electrophorus electricus]|uniref:growth hormone secretagogue receptor type 1-like n=1 Tax=Electrophorus electricus TaxID=8005 RepID=UPI0015D02A22|nr:growth hormone secretagogue receptor type 1-like [Electrophorus electricus]